MKLPLPAWPVALFALVLAGAAHAQTYTVLCAKTACGQLRVAQAGNRIDVDYAYRNNGRGPTQKEVLEFAPDGAWTAYRAEGTSTYGARIDEHFELKDGRASWRSTVDAGARADVGRGHVYLPVQGSPAWIAQLARTLVQRPDGRSDALPAGRLKIERLQQLSLAGESGDVGLYLITGLDLEPSFVWLREGSHELFAQVDPGWGATVLQGHEAQVQTLAEAQKAAQLARQQRLARELPTRLAGLTVIEGVRWFDAPAARLRGPSDVYLFEGRITAVTAPGALKAVAPAHRISGRGRTLLPGLVDMHAHLDGRDLLLDLAAGVTAVRDVGNSNDELAELRGRIERGEVLGPRVAANGLIEGRSPYSLQSGIVADDLPAALAAIDHYAARGVRQLKLYNSIHPEWVRPMAAHAHALGLRVGGHVPAFMTAREAVEAGFDELHHINQLTLNFLVGKADDTRTLLRFNLVGEQAADLKLDDRRTRDFIALLKRHGTVVDATMTAFEAQFTQRQSQPNPSYTAISAHLPAVVQRSLLAAETEFDDRKARRWGASWRVMTDLLRRLHAAGVTLVAGTDATAGFALQRELELYVQAGIPAAEVLRIATWNGARHSDRLADIGSIERGKRADLLLVEGDPVADIGAIRRVALVFQGLNGETRALQPAVLYEAIGIRPFVPAAEITQ